MRWQASLLDYSHNYDNNVDVLVAGGYAFVAFTDDTQHHVVHRFDAATGDYHGKADLGPNDGETGFLDGHYHIAIVHDRTDDTIVACRAGRWREVVDGGDLLPAVAKTAHAFGGTNEQWAAGDFGAYASLPYPIQGSVSYAMPVMTAQGSLVWVMGGRMGYSHPTNNASWTGLHIYRYRGDGTPKTAAQLASGTYELFIDRNDDSTDGRIYNGLMVERAGRIALTWGSIYDATATWRRYATGYLYCDNADDASWVWRDVAGTAHSIPLPPQNSINRTQPLYADLGTHYVSGGAVSLDSLGNPAIVSFPSVTSSGDMVMDTAGVSVYEYADGWQESVRVAQTARLDGDGVQFGLTCLHDSQDRLVVVRSWPHGDGYTVERRDDGTWETLGEYGEVRPVGGWWSGAGWPHIASAGDELILHTGDTLTVLPPTAPALILPMLALVAEEEPPPEPLTAPALTLPMLALVAEEPVGPLTPPSLITGRITATANGSRDTATIMGSDRWTARAEAHWPE